MSATIDTKKSRCADCGIADQFPAEFTQEEATTYCEVCSFHRNHGIVHDFRCPICVARVWQAWLRAFRILLFHPSVWRASDL
jgi:hypothetical protein